MVAARHIENQEKKRGDRVSFDRNWQERKEALYTHWTRAYPQNQIQLAFRNHWEVFRLLMENSRFNRGNRCLEVGCGRGSISAYFSDAGYECTLVDISQHVVQIAQKIFENNALRGTFVVGDVRSLPFPDSSFDIIVSIGLLEHFESITLPIKEQIRILDSGGLFLGYVVPKYTQNVQTHYEWVNDILKGYVGESESREQKAAIYRSDADSTPYITLLKKCHVQGIQASGIYCLPMISHSPEFPFTLMPPESESALVKYFETILEMRRKETERHPWLCKEGYGQAFLVWGFKE
jgi:ubiquinone/menaquinone biosynthesis C-methylase UbiE